MSFVNVARFVGMLCLNEDRVTGDPSHTRWKLDSGWKPMGLWP